MPFRCFLWFSHKWLKKQRTFFFTLLLLLTDDRIIQNWQQWKGYTKFQQWYTDSNQLKLCQLEYGNSRECATADLLTYCVSETVKTAKIHAQLRNCLSQSITYGGTQEGTMGEKGNTRHPFLRLGLKIPKIDHMEFIFERQYTACGGKHVGLRVLADGAVFSVLE